ncbi:MAG: CxxC-x17-CxxC domain-containing protein [Candidatus Roizmanbacteria bacterium]
MPDYRKSNKPAGGDQDGFKGRFEKPSYVKPGFNRSGGHRDGSHPAICATCGKACEVPFKPNGLKPVYCAKCFRAANGTSAPGALNNATPLAKAKPLVQSQESQSAHTDALMKSIIAKLDHMSMVMDQILAKQ